jgi:branched-subunit amino acid aminotransferase/4-amino-4-deoxychorismate lyase
VLELCRANEVPTAEESIARSALLGMDGIFLTNSGHGIVPVAEIDAQKVQSSPMVAQLQGWLSAAEMTEGESPSA